MIRNRNHTQRGRRSTYSVRNASTEKVFIVDHDGPLSVTNDAEAVCAELNEEYPGRRIIYRDTDGNWDELVHENGRFIKFALAR